MTFGELIRELMNDEQCYERNQRDAERIRVEKGPLYARWHFAAADVVRRQRNKSEDVIELLCNAKFGSRLSHENALKLRGELWKVHGLSLDTIDALSLEDVVNLFRKEPRSNDSDDKSANKRPKQESQYATQPPGDGWHNEPLTGNQKQLAHWVGVALQNKRVDVTVLATMHGKSVWIFRVNRTTCRAYFRDAKTYAVGNAARLSEQTGTQTRPKPVKRGQTG